MSEISSSLAPPSRSQRRKTLPEGLQCPGSGRQRQMEFVSQRQIAHGEQGGVVPAGAAQHGPVEDDVADLVAVDVADHAAPQPLQAVVERELPSFDQAVGVEQQGRAWFDGEGRVRVAGIGKGAEGKTGPALDEIRRSVGPAEQRRKMTGVGQDQLAGAGIEDPEDERGHMVGAVDLGEEFVELFQDGGRLPAVPGVGPQGIAELPHERSSGGFPCRRRRPWPDRRCRRGGR